MVRGIPKYVCFKHRVVRKANSCIPRGKPLCPTCREEMTLVHNSFKTPSSNDLREWQSLEKKYRSLKK